MRNKSVCPIDNFLIIDSSIKHVKISKRTNLSFRNIISPIYSPSNVLTRYTFIITVHLDCDLTAYAICLLSSELTIDSLTLHIRIWLIILFQKLATFYYSMTLKTGYLMELCQPKCHFCPRGNRLFLHGQNLTSRQQFL